MATFIICLDPSPALGGGGGVRTCNGDGSIELGAIGNTIDKFIFRSLLHSRIRLFTYPPRSPPVYPFVRLFAGSIISPLHPSTLPSISHCFTLPQRLPRSFLPYSLICSFAFFVCAPVYVFVQQDFRFAGCVHTFGCSLD